MLPTDVAAVAESDHPSLRPWLPLPTHLWFRSQTLTRWKRLRIHMEQQLADKLAQQQADLDEQLAFVQV